MPVPIAIGAIIAGGFSVALRYLVPQIIAYVLVSLGIGFVTYLGTQQIMDYGIDLVNQRLDAMPSNLVGIAELAGVFDAFSILISGLTTSLTIMSISRITKFKIKGVPSNMQ